VRSTLRKALEIIKKTPATEEEVEDLYGNEEIVNMAKQLNGADENNDQELQQTLRTQIVALITSISPSAARAAVRSTLRKALQFIKKTSATDEEVEDLCGKEEIVNLAKQLNSARGNNDRELWETLRVQLVALITTSQGSSKTIF